MSEDSQTKLAAAFAAKVKAFSRKTPEERFQWLIDRGLVDSDGNLTERVGGDAQPVSRVRK